MWTVTEDEELFEKDIRVAVQAVLTDAVLWDELVARGKSGPRTQKAQEYASKRVLHYARTVSPWSELSEVGGLVMRGSLLSAWANTP